ncbi:MAG TPA: hypothetical protein VFV34_21060 [Blastocatellia bacterium]|nr:hypothetical protein [Blastocatellia bacterium]
MVRQKCTVCHETDLIAQQRLTRAGWTREVDKMIRWGTELTDSEREAAIGYLSLRFGPRPMSGSGVSGEIERGRSILESSCLSCHEMDLIEQQRLSRAGWTREVDKMIRWGADVKETDKGPLIDYLSGKYRQR